ncbi:MAG: CPBP family intramembrane metalloprotease [Terricaulis sp.]
MPAFNEGRTATTLAVLLYALAWAGSVAYMAVNGGEWFSPVAVLGVFGALCGAVAWVLTLKTDAPAVEIKRPALESWAFLAYLAVYAVGFLGFGLSAARGAFPPGRAQEILVIAVKLGAHVLLPAILLLLLRARLPIFQSKLKPWRFWLVLVVMGALFLAINCVISPSLQHIADLHASAQTLALMAPLAYAWISVEAGFNEEFLYRAVLQNRLSAWFKSPIAAICVTALLFGLAHAPGLYLRGGVDDDGASHNLLMVVAYTIGVLSPVGVLFGMLYARTKSLLLVVLLHGLVDILPGLPEFIKIWG